VCFLPFPCVTKEIGREVGKVGLNTAMMSQSGEGRWRLNPGFMHAKHTALPPAPQYLFKNIGFYVSDA
jgi:hypothetical protein